MHKIRVAFVFGAIFLSVAASTSFAATTKTREPLSPAQENIDKNAQKKPGNKGLHSAKRKTSKIVNKNTLGKHAEKASEQKKSGHAKRREDSGIPLRIDR